MSFFNNFTKAFLMILFVVGCFAILYYVYFVMPYTVLAEINYSAHQEIIEKIRVAIQPFLILIFAQIILTVGIIVWNRNTDKFRTSIIYVDKYKDKIETQIIEDERNKIDFYQQKYTQVFQKIESSTTIYDTLISELCDLTESSAGAVFTKITENEQNYIELKADYAYQKSDNQKVRYQFGEGITGQVAKNGKLIQLKEIPEGYIQVFSGLGKASPSHLLIIPILDVTQEVLGVIELASFHAFSAQEIEFIEKLGQKMSKIINIEVV